MKFRDEMTLNVIFLWMENQIEIFHSPEHCNQLYHIISRSHNQIRTSVWVTNITEFMTLLLNNDAAHIRECDKVLRIVPNACFYTADQSRAIDRHLDNVNLTTWRKTPESSESTKQAPLRRFAGKGSSYSSTCLHSAFILQTRTAIKKKLGLIASFPRFPSVLECLCTP